MNYIGILFSCITTAYINSVESTDNDMHMTDGTEEVKTDATPAEQESAATPAEPTDTEEAK